MGLGVFIQAPLERLRLELRSLDAIAAAAKAAIDDPLLAQFAEIERSGEHEIGLSIHPAAEPLLFMLEPGLLTASSQTSAAGPGYHAYVVELLERLGHEQEIEWRWTDAAGEPGDECDFHDTRDFGSVQAAMLRWLRGLAEHFIELRRDEDVENIRISLPMDVAPVRPGEICSPMGVWTPDWLEELADANEARLAAAGSRFFAWWGRGCDAEFWNRLGQVVCWTDIPWRPPLSEAERSTYDRALSAFDRSRELAPDSVLPDLEIRELRRLRVTAAESASPPRPKGLGFNRGPMCWKLTGEWTLELPGYWYQEIDDDSLFLWFGDKSIHASSLSVEGAAGRDLLASATRNQAYSSDDQLVRWSRNHLHAQAVVQRDESDGQWVLRGCVAAEGSLCIVTFCFGDEQDRAWAENVFRTVSRPPRA